MSLELDLSLLAIGLAIAIRFGVLTATLPFLDSRSVPPVWRVALAGCFAAALTPAVAAKMGPGALALSWQMIVAESVRSLTIGVLLGFAVNLVFAAVKMAGEVAGMQVGFAIVNAFDPMTNSQVSVLSQFYYLLAVLLFFATGGHHVLVEAMFQSCLVIPPFSSLDPSGGAWYLLNAFGGVFSLGLRIAAPVVLVLLLVSAAMGVIVKTVPQMNILAVGFPVQIAAGLLVLGLSLVFFKTILLDLFAGLPDRLGEVLLALQ